MPEDSLKKRYIYKLGTSLINLVISLFVQAIVPRSLGPKSYGDLSFVTNFFQQIINFFDLWTTPCFFIKFSQRLNEFGLIIFTFNFVFACSIILLTGIFLIPANSLLFSTLLPGQIFVNIILGAVLAIILWISQIFNNLTDAYGLTVKSEIGRVIQKMIGFVMIFTLYAFNKLNIVNYFYTQYVTLLFLILAFGWIVKQNRGKIIEGWKISIQKIKIYSSEFYKFSHPLFTYGLIGLSTGILDRWLLQKFGGSVEQGFFSISNQVGMVCFLFTSAMTPLIMREFSVAAVRKDINKIALLFRQYIPLLFSIAAYISCFLIIQADKVTIILGGSAYKNASIAVAIMCLYPIHQSYGQLNGSVFMATGQTSLYSKIGILFMVMGLPITYFLVASKHLLGMNAGATGLAIKMVAIQFFAVNIQLYFVAKYLKINFIKYIGHQVISVSCLLVLSFLVLLIEKSVFSIQDNIILKFIFSGFVYSTMVLLLIYIQPLIFGLTKNDLKVVLNSISIKQIKNN